MLSPVKHEERLRHLSAIARKVYEAVPKSEPWSLSYINSELQRTGGTGRDTRILLGCLNGLKIAGLVEEPTRGTFIRVGVRAEKIKPAPIESQPQQEVKPMPTAIVKPAAKTMPAIKTARDPSAIFADLAARCRQLADDFELAGMEVGEQMAQQGKEAEQLQQLRKLLGSMG